jgi:muramoyltetrapeptide carboxypeptidase LdcA involved in peptidoglycan recycling
LANQRFFKMMMLFPKKLTEGDTVAVLSPSWGGPSLFPHIYEQGLTILREEFGLVVKAYPTATATAQWLYHHPQARAADINAAFADPTVKAIIASIGGDDSIRILPYLDQAVIRHNPKILLGYSDTTTLLTYCNQLGLVTFHGPAVMAGFSQLRSWPPAFADHIRTLLFAAHTSYTYQSYPVWTERYPDWSDPANTGLSGPLQSNEEKWQWLQGEEVWSGQLFGGCIEVLEFMKGTAYWPPLDFWAGKILFFETSEEKPTPQQVKYMLRNYGMQGILAHIQGLLFGRPRDYTPQEKQELNETLVAVVASEFGRPDLPIVTNMDFGHTDPQFILPLGVKAELDCERRVFRLLESPVK